MRSIAILGRGRLGCAAVREALAAGWDVRMVVTNKPEPAWDLTPQRMLLSDNVPYAWPRIPVDRSGDWRNLIGLEVDVVLSVLYDRIIGKALIDGPARVLNLHLGKLPEYRGMRPINWALHKGDATAGVTLHEVDEGIDTGPIVGQTTFSIWPEVDEVRDVYRRAVHAAEGILRDTMPRLDVLPAVAQDESRAAYYNAQESALVLGERTNWTRAESQQEAQAILRQKDWVRAADEYRASARRGWSS